MEYLNIAKTDYLSVNQMNAIYNNFQFLKEKLQIAGAPVGELVDSSVTYDIADNKVLEKFNAVEQNIQTLHDSLFYLLDKDEKYYKNFLWEINTQDRRSEVWRWIDWMNEAKEISRYELLRDVNGEMVVDVNDEKILVLQENK